MAQRYGGKIVTNGLVLCLDAHDAKSYAGEPTQNYVINTSSTGGWWGDGSSQTGLGSKGAVAITDENLKYNGYDTVLWTPGTSRNCYLNSTEDFNYSETSTEWTFSAYLKYEDGSTISSMSVYMYYPSSDGSGTGTVTDVGGGWYRVRRTRTGSSNYISLAGFTGIAAMKKIYISGWQLEKKQYTTPVTSPATSRSATDGWVDRSGNSNSGTLVNGTNTGVSHYRDGQVIMPVANSYLDFDGSDDKVDCGSVTPDTGDFTIEFIYQLTGNGGRGGLFERKAGSPYNGFSFGQGGSGDWSFAVSGTSNYSAGSYLKRSWTYPTLNTWYNDVGVYSGGNSVSIYRNGLLVSSTSGSAQGNLSTQGTRTNFLIANRDNSTSLPCKVGLVRVYNKALTAAEVLSNYNATKNRFT
jgi:hypothetical protein